MTTIDRLARLGINAPADDSLVSRACAEIRRCANLALTHDSETIRDIYEARAQRLAALLAAGPQGRASWDESEAATAALAAELA